MESSKLFYHHLIIYTMLFCLDQLHVASTNISTNKQGFSLKLIDPFSPLSPFYNPNLTDTERLNTIMLSDRHRIHYLTSLRNPDSNKTVDPKEIRPILRTTNDLTYMVEVGIGTGAAYENNYLHFDTGSSLTWIQCEPCAQCFPQLPRIFNPQNSPTYGALMFNNPFCQGRNYRPGPNGQCEFSISYVDDTSADGTLSSDVFTFPASQGGSVQVPNMAFGCVHRTDSEYELGGPVGIMGLNLDQKSLIVQAPCAPVTGKRFSYCLVEPGSTIPMSLRFGDDITWPPLARIQGTRILRYNTGIAQYFLNLTGLSLDGTGIYFPPGTFEPTRPGDGFIIDSGAHFSYLPKLAFLIVRRAVKSHFEAPGRNLEEVPGEGSSRLFPLCFALPQNADLASLLPSMTFHFEGGDLLLNYEQVFYVNRQNNQVCLAMFSEDRDEDRGVLGAFQQVNTQFEYDMRLGAFLRFATMDCAHGV